MMTMMVIMMVKVMKIMIMIDKLLAMYSFCRLGTDCKPSVVLILFLLDIFLKLFLRWLCFQQHLRLSSSTQPRFWTPVTFLMRLPARLRTFNSVNCSRPVMVLILKFKNAKTRMRFQLIHSSELSCVVKKLNDLILAERLPGSKNISQKRKSIATRSITQLSGAVQPIVSK